MRLAAFLIAVAVAAPFLDPPAAAQRAAVPADWSQRVATTAVGGILIGNPNAPVKLVEFGSLTCPHCRAFHEQGLPGLRANGLSDGRLSYEFRPFSINGIDLMAGLLVQCQAAAPGWALVNRVFARQDELIAGFQAISESERPRIEALPQDKQGPAMAELGKLPQFAAAAGISRARYDACIADKPGMERLLEIRRDAVETHGLKGTPSFLINGRIQADVFDWPALQPLLVAALKAAPTTRTK